MEDLPTTAGNDILVENAGGRDMFKEIGDERTFNGILPANNNLLCTFCVLFLNFFYIILTS